MFSSSLGRVALRTNFLLKSRQPLLTDSFKRFNLSNNLSLLSSATVPPTFNKLTNNANNTTIASVHNINNKISKTRRTFSTSHVKFNQQTQAVNDILKNELNLENEALNEELPKLFKEYLDKYHFKVLETPGRNEAQIRRTRDDGEIVSVFFDVSQVANLPYDKNEIEENMRGKEDENEIDQNNELDPEFNEQAEIMDGLDRFGHGEDNFANVNVIISKNVNITGDSSNTNGNGALSFELLMNLEDRSFFIENVTSFKSIDELLSDSADTQFKRELQYKGPPFSNLDEELQESLELYLESRGINEELATFISVYSEFKENNEYISWLKKMKTFFE